VRLGLLLSKSKLIRLKKSLAACVSTTAAETTLWQAWCVWQNHGLVLPVKTAEYREYLAVGAGLKLYVKDTKLNGKKEGKINYGKLESFSPLQKVL
jgi:hypothetical protein